MTAPIMHDMKIREQEYEAVKTTVNVLNNEMRKQRTDVRQALLLKNTTLDNQKSIKNMDEKYEVTKSQIEFL